MTATLDLPTDRPTLPPLPPSPVWEYIDAATATRYLERSYNRDINKGRVARYSDLMTRGRWLPTGDAVEFDTDGFLINAQHRMRAVIKSDTAQPFLVARGLPRASQDVRDSGLQRSLADALKLRGFPSPNIIATIIPPVFKCDRDNWTNLVDRRPSRQEELEFAEANRVLLQHAARRAVNLRRRSPVKAPASVLGCGYVLIARQQPDDVEPFFTVLETGVDEGPGGTLGVRHPVRALRDRYLSEYTTRTVKSVKTDYIESGVRKGRHYASRTVPQEYALAWMVKAYNLWVQDSGVSGPIAFRGRGRAAEAFPRVMLVERVDGSGQRLDDAAA